VRAAKRSTTRGRPHALDGAAIAEARRRHHAGEDAAKLAAELGVSRATLYRALVSK
jgi:DNA-binding phage protein